MTADPTPEQLRVFIAEKCGWTECQPGELTRYGFFPPHGRKLLACGSRTPARIPDYPNSLDAMADAVKVLTEVQKIQFSNVLREVILKQSPVNCCEQFDLINATAAQRALAFYKVLGGER